MFCTSGIVADVMFLHNGANRPESKTARCFIQFPRGGILRHKSMTQQNNANIAC